MYNTSSLSKEAIDIQLYRANGDNEKPQHFYCGILTELQEHAASLAEGLSVTIAWSYCEIRPLQSTANSCQVTIMPVGFQELCG